MKNPNRALRNVSAFLIFCLMAALLLRGTPSMASDFPIGSFLTDFDLGGVVMLDGSVVDGSYRRDRDDGHDFDGELRRARLSLKYQPTKDWQAKLQINFDDEDDRFDLGDAYLRYKGFKKLVVTAGQMKEPLGLENLGSSKNTTFIERSMVSNALCPGRHPGIQLSGYQKGFGWALGGFAVDEEEEEADPYAMSGRLTWAPVKTRTQTVHLGVSGSWRDLDGDIFEVEEPAEVHTAEEVINSAKIDTDSLWLTGVEAAWVYGPFSVQSEYMRADLQAVKESRDAIIEGGYIQGSYFLTGESKRYKKGVFKKIKPLSPAGAWELAARYSILDASDVKKGEKGETVTLGINYYVNEDIKVMANLLHSEVDNEDDGTACAVRLQYVF